ncbi:MAG: LLM class flavin-dependent oxidoreductase, partial [Rubrivivax sp.]|nr:LLM class flavin-dependent oxidoreductase [Rubrivivax sp.]
HFTSIQQRFLGMRRGQRGPLPRPVATMDGLWTEAERVGVEQMLAATAVGGPDTVARQLSQIVAATAADELIVAGAMHDHTARLRSYQILAGLRDTLQVAQAA